MFIYTLITSPIRFELYYDIWYDPEIFIVYFLDLYADLDMPDKSSNKNKSKPKEVKSTTGIDVSFGKTTSIENQEKTTTDKTFTKSDKVHCSKMYILTESNTI